MGSFRNGMKPSVGAVLAATCAVVLFSAGSMQGAQLEATYAHSLTVKFPGYTGSATLTNFPVLVRLPAGFDYASCQAGGADLRFAAADGELLDSEIDTWNPSGESLVCVRVPQLMSGAFRFHILRNSAITWLADSAALPFSSEVSSQRLTWISSPVSL